MIGMFTVYIRRSISPPLNPPPCIVPSFGARVLHVKKVYSSARDWRKKDFKSCPKTCHLPYVLHWLCFWYSTLFHRAE